MDDAVLVRFPSRAIATLEPEIGPASTIAHPLVATEASTTGPISPAAAVILRHAGQGEDDPGRSCPA